MKGLFSILKISMLISVFIFLCAGFNGVSAFEQDLNLVSPELYIYEGSTAIVGSFTTGDIKSGTSAQILFQGSDNSSSKHGTVYLYLNGLLVLNTSVSGTSAYELIDVAANVTLNPNTVYEISARAQSRGIYVRNFKVNTQIYNTKPALGGITNSGIIVNTVNENNYTLTLTGVTDVDSLDELQLSYSYDNQNFTTLSGSINAGILNGNYNLNLDLFDRLDGDINVYIKLNDGIVDSDTESILLTKDTSDIIPTVVTSITVTDIVNQSKGITMTTTSGTGYYNINTTGICDDTLEYTLYEELTFDLYSDNGKYVCYKIDYGRPADHYVISDQITGIVGTMSYGRGNVFSGYTDWVNSSQVKQNDTTMAFLSMMVNTTAVSSTNVDTSYPSSLIDINGDGLVDMLYTNYSSYTIYDNGFAVNRSRKKYAIMINNGDYTFTPVYRCVQDDNTYYGNCADITNY